MQFDIWGVLIILGLAQSLYVIVHLVISSKSKSQILVPIIFFMNIFVALIVSFAGFQWEGDYFNLQLIEWLFWSLLPLTATLFSVQLLKINKFPSLGFWFWPLFYIVAVLILNQFFILYSELRYAFEILAIFSGCFSILFIWLFEGNISLIRKLKNGKERFWVIVCLLLVSIGLMTLILLSLFDILGANQFKYTSIWVALTFTYLGTTSLFRIYPYPVDLKKRVIVQKLTKDELRKAKLIEDLLYRDKVYQEPGYNRANLAREVEVSETQLTKIVKSHFDKTVPLLFNELRVDDAKSLLKETQAEITVIAFESGFNSLATFNRVFKELTGFSPSKYRDE